MKYLGDILFYCTGFFIIAIAAHHISKFFRRIKLPQITGLLITGIVAGPFILHLLVKRNIDNLLFINDFSLAFIAFAAGSELYIKELRSRFKSITWMTFSQISITFIGSSIIVYLIADLIPFMRTLQPNIKLTIAMLAGTIFVARSPASAIAVIQEMRAKGPFTQTAMGVTVITDVLVIVIFSICFSVARTLITGTDFDIFSVLILFLELIISLCVGYIIFIVINFVLYLRMHTHLKTTFILLAGWSAFGLTNLLSDLSKDFMVHGFYLEPLLICITASFLVTNNRYRNEFLKLINDIAPYIYVVFFTLTGASLALDVLIESWTIAFIFIFIRLITMICGALLGGKLAGDSWNLNRIAWMPYVTQAGVSIGLVTIIANEFGGWALQLSTILIASIVINQLIGPPLFKWAIELVGEGRIRAVSPPFDGTRDAVIFGLEGQSITLARKLQSHGWSVKIASRRANRDEYKHADIQICQINNFTMPELKRVNTHKAEAIVLMNTDDENYEICELAYQNFGTKDMVVRLNERINFNKFHELGALIVEPTTAIVSLLDHLVRSPNAAPLLLGTAKDQDTVDIEITNPNIHGLALRDLRLPFDILVLTIKRGDHTMLSHGYTRLRIGDIVTIVGSIDSIENVRWRLQ